MRRKLGLFMQSSLRNRIKSVQNIQCFWLTGWILFWTLNNVCIAQNSSTIEYSVKVHILGSTDCDDCWGDPELHWWFGVMDEINDEFTSWEYESSDCTPNPVDAIIVTTSNFPITIFPENPITSLSTVYCYGTALEADNASCGWHDGDCGDYQELGNFDVCVGDPGEWHWQIKILNCTSEGDDEEVSWTFEYEFLYVYDYVDPGTIQLEAASIYPVCGEPCQIIEKNNTKLVCSLKK